MEELFGAVLELLLEGLLEFLLGLAAAGAARGLRRMLVSKRRIGPLLTMALIALAGCAAGLLSVWIVPHPIMHRVRFQGASLIISPVVCSTLLGWFGRGVRRRGRQSVAVESFWFGFVFAFAIALVRFLFVHHVVVS